MARRSLWKKLLILPACCLSACAVDLGSFEKSDGYQSYYDSLGDVTGLYDGGSHEYDVETSLFNKLTVEKYSWDKSDYQVYSEQYVYLIIPFEKALKIENIAFSLYCTEQATMSFSLFYFLGESEAPKKIKYWSSPDTEPIYDEDDNIIGEKEIEYDDPDVSTAILRGEAELPKATWQSFGMANFRQEGYDDYYLHTGEDGLLYIRIENNSGWNRDTMEPTTFRFLNLMMRAI